MSQLSRLANYLTTIDRKEREGRLLPQIRTGLTSFRDSNQPSQQVLPPGNNILREAINRAAIPWVPASRHLSTNLLNREETWADDQTEGRPCVRVASEGVSLVV